MTDRTETSRQRQRKRIAGHLPMIVIAAGLIAEALAGAAFVVPGDAGATVRNIALLEPPFSVRLAAQTVFFKIQTGAQHALAGVRQLTPVSYFEHAISALSPGRVMALDIDAQRESVSVVVLGMRWDLTTR